MVFRVGRAGRKMGITPSLGQFTEQPDNPELTDWEGYYFYEIDIHSFGTLHNEDACVQQGVLDRLPVVGPPPPTGLPTVPVICLNMTELPLFDEYGEEIGCLVSDF